MEHWFDHQPNDETAQQQKSEGKRKDGEFEGGRSEGVGEEMEFEIK